MKQITLGTTGITVPQNAFGALPIQRVDFETAKAILLRAWEGGIRFFDTARAYSDSEEKLGYAFSELRDKIYIATKTTAKTGLYEAALKAKEQGKIRHIGVTAHKLGVAEECIESGLYETLQFPLSYLSSEKDLELVRMCQEKNMGFIAMKGLAGGLISNSRAAFSYMSQFDHVLPIWGIQRMTELDEWLSYMDNPPAMDDDIRRFIEAEKEELTGDFCRGCGYCLPCPAGIPINNCARMSLMVRRAPSAAWLNETWQENMKKIENCLECGQCSSRCPYELDTPNLLKKNYEDYKNILAGKTSIS